MSKRSLQFKTPSPVKLAKQDTPLSPSKISEESPQSTVEAMVSCVSGIYSSRYFEGEITDGDIVTRFVGFDKPKREKLLAFYNQGKAVTLKNCQIQYNKYNQQFEVVIKGYTKIEPSTAEFKIEDIETVQSESISLDELQQKSEHDRVNVQVQVVKVNQPAPTGNKTKQEISIADESGVATLTLWDLNINRLTEGMSYKLTRLIVCTYRGKNTLAMPNIGSFIKEIDDIEEIAEESEEETTLNVITEATVIGIQIKYLCVSCKKATIEPTNSNIAECQHCNTMQLIDKTTQTITAKLILASPKNNQITLRANETILKEIVAGKEISYETLLGASAANITYDDYFTITDVSP